MFTSRNMVNLRENTDFSQKIHVKGADLKSVVESLLDKLSAKQKLVLSSRFGIGNGEPKTLEAIGKSLNITRERVRQIEGDAVKALKKAEKVRNLDELTTCVKEIVGENGGVIRAEKLAKETFSRYSGKREFSPQKARILEIIFLMTGIKKSRANREMEDSWIHADFDKRYLKATVDELEKVFDTGKKILGLEEVLKKIDLSQISQKFPEMKLENITSFLEVSKKFGQNVFGAWGKARWPLIRPRGVREKATLVLMKTGKPLP